MPLLFQRNDLTKVQTDAVVLPANPFLEEGPGISRALFHAAGEEALTAACQRLGRVDYGNAVMTDGFALPARYIIHTAVPYWIESDPNVPRQLYSCYKSSLELAAKSGLTSIAFPLLSSGRFSCPKNVALDIAINAIRDFMNSDKAEPNSRDIVRSLATEPSEMMIYMIVYDEESFKAAVDFSCEVDEFISNTYVEERARGEKREEELVKTNASVPIVEPFKGFMLRNAEADDPDYEADAAVSANALFTDELDAIIAGQTENFNDTLQRFISNSGLTNKEVYFGANLTKQAFSRIVSGGGYTPKKSSILALAIGLKLNLKDTRYLLMKAGYALSDNTSDSIVSYCIEHGIYDIDRINILLLVHDGELLGSKTA